MDTNELREKVARAMHETMYPNSLMRNERYALDLADNPVYRMWVDAAIATVLDHLIAEAEKLGTDDHNQLDIRIPNGSWATLTGWLAKFKETPDADSA